MPAGLEEARRWLREFVSFFQGMTIEIIEIIDSGDKVLLGMTQRGRPRGTSASVEGSFWTEIWQVSTFRGAEIVKAEMFRSRARALEAAGLSE